MKNQRRNVKLELMFFMTYLFSKECANELEFHAKNARLGQY